MHKGCWLQSAWIRHILNVSHENDLQLHVQGRSCTFPRAGGSVYIKYNDEVLWRLISDLIAHTFCLLLCGWGSTRPTLKSCLALSKALSELHNTWQEQICLHGAVSCSFPNLSGDIGASTWGFAIATPGSPLLGWHLQPHFLVKVRLAVSPWHSACIKAAWNLQLAGCVEDFKKDLKFHLSLDSASAGTDIKLLLD